MKTFFSIIYLTLNANLNEKISIGLLMSDGERSIFKVSNPKMNVIKGLVPQQNFNVLKSYFKNINYAIMPKINDYELDVKQNVSSKWLNESYFSYLHRYSNNLVSFSEPRTIELSLNEDSFKKLFSKYIFDYDDEVLLVKHEDILSKVKTKLYSKIEDRVNLNVQVSPKDFAELVTPVDINFIGRNGVVVAGQTIDFDKRQYYLENDLTRFISFTKAVDYSNEDKGKYFLVGKEPNKKEHPQNHRTWKHVKESHLVEYVDLSETEKIKEYIVSKNVTPYFEKNNEASN